MSSSFEGKIRLKAVNWPSFVNGDEATLKKVKRVDGGIMLVAFNSSVYEPHFYSNKEIADLPVKIYGKVVELRGKF